jgi:hypothetical protein
MFIGNKKFQVGPHLLKPHLFRRNCVLAQGTTHNDFAGITQTQKSMPVWGGFFLGVKHAEACD